MKPIALMKTAAMLAALGLCVSSVEARAAQSDARTIASLMKELDQLETELTQVEDVAAVKKLQRAYGFYLDKGMWADLSALFADDAVAAYPAGVFVGKKSITAHIWQNVGANKGVGLGDGRLYNHMVLQPVVNIMPDGKTAKGRWRVLAQIGRFPTAGAEGSAQWAGGIYENTYVKQNGVWKIKDLHYYSSFSAPYEGGWAKVTPVPVPPRAGGPGGPGGAARGPGTAGGLPGGGGRDAGAGGGPGRGAAPTPIADVAVNTTPPPVRQNLAPNHPPDRPRDPTECGGFPKACIEPFHYNNPVTGRETK